MVGTLEWSFCVALRFGDSIYYSLGDEGGLQGVRSRVEKGFFGAVRLVEQINILRRTKRSVTSRITE